MKTNKLNSIGEDSPALMNSVGSTYLQGGIQRTVLQVTDYADDLRVNLNLIQVRNGTSAAPHSHPGLEITYVLEGEFDLVSEGEPDRRFGPGMTYMVPPDAVHYARVIGAQPIKLLCLFLHQRNSPVAIVAQQ
nr:cupin domain-containing protein [uncultured Duganella sp.]